MLLLLILFPFLSLQTLLLVLFSLINIVFFAFHIYIPFLVTFLPFLYTFRFPSVLLFCIVLYFSFFVVFIPGTYHFPFQSPLIPFNLSPYTLFQHFYIYFPVPFLISLYSLILYLRFLFWYLILPFFVPINLLNPDGCYVFRPY